MMHSFAMSNRLCRQQYGDILRGGWLHILLVSVAQEQKRVGSVHSAELVTKQAAKNRTFPAGQAGDAMATYAHLQFLPLLMNNIPTFIVHNVHQTVSFHENYFVLPA